MMQGYRFFPPGAAGPAAAGSAAVRLRGRCAAWFSAVSGRGLRGFGLSSNILFPVIYHVAFSQDHRASGRLHARP